MSTDIDLYGGTDILRIASKIDEKLKIIANNVFSVGSDFAQLKDEFKESPKAVRMGVGGWRGFCKQRWGMSKTQVNRLIAASTTFKNLKVAPPGSTFPTAEAQVRHLTQFNSDPELQGSLWQQAVDQADGQPTEETVKKVVIDYHNSKDAPELEAGSVGEQVEDQQETDWERMDREAQEQVDEQNRKVDEEHRENQERIREANERFKQAFSDLYARSGLDLTPEEKEIARRIIRKAKQIMAPELHPDRGGSHDEMVIFNNTITKLSNAIG